MMFQTFPAVEVGSAAEIVKRERERERKEEPGCMVFQTVPAVEVGSAAAAHLVCSHRTRNMSCIHIQMFLETGWSYII
mgnify:CR=1 FL=1